MVMLVLQVQLELLGLLVLLDHMANVDNQVLLDQVGPVDQLVL